MVLLLSTKTSSSPTSALSSSCGCAALSIMTPSWYFWNDLEDQPQPHESQHGYSGKVLFNEAVELVSGTMEEDYHNDTVVGLVVEQVPNAHIEHHPDNPRLPATGTGNLRVRSVLIQHQHNLEYSSDDSSILRAKSPNKQGNGPSDVANVEAHSLVGLSSPPQRLGAAAAARSNLSSVDTATQDKRDAVEDCDPRRSTGYSADVTRIFDQPHAKDTGTNLGPEQSSLASFASATPISINHIVRHQNPAVALGSAALPQEAVDAPSSMVVPKTTYPTRILKGEQHPTQLQQLHHHQQQQQKELQEQPTQVVRADPDGSLFDGDDQGSDASSVSFNDNDDSYHNYYIHHNQWLLEQQTHHHHRILQHEQLHAHFNYFPATATATLPLPPSLETAVSPSPQVMEFLVPDHLPPPTYYASKEDEEDDDDYDDDDDDDYDDEGEESDSSLFEPMSSPFGLDFIYASDTAYRRRQRQERCRRRQSVTLLGNPSSPLQQHTDLLFPTLPSHEGLAAYYQGDYFHRTALTASDAIYPDSVHEDTNYFATVAAQGPEIPHVISFETKASAS
ncbi:hypothetical protein ACA910_006414 [Epithemia clementina (nom. ined.)]